MGHPRSLRERLQGTTFLAVLAGYGVLLVLNQGLGCCSGGAPTPSWWRRRGRRLDAGRLVLPAIGPLRLPGGDEVRPAGRP